MKKYISRLSAALLTISLVLPLGGCSGIAVKGEDMTGDTKANEIEGEYSLEEGREAVANFSVRLFKESLAKDGNTLISPVSVIYAISMTANGGKGDTLSQMEEVLGMPISRLNTYLHGATDILKEDENSSLSVANSIWLKDSESLSVREEFLQTNAENYGAQVYRTAFDASALKDINDWVKENTNGMIEKILDKISNEAVMYIINAIAFDAQWQETYEEYQVRDGIFTAENGTKQDAEMMYSEENAYIETDNATGFLKYYGGRKYAFAAILPNEGISLSDYVASLTGEKLTDMLNNARNAEVSAAIPKFESEYGVSMKDILIAMGMKNAFDPDLADFSALGTSMEGNIHINNVLHKTFISVNEQGTRAGGSTIVEMVAESAMIEDEIKEVFLDRPFMYMIIDCEADIPIFIGAVTNLK